MGCGPKAGLRVDVGVQGILDAVEKPPFVSNALLRGCDQGRIAGSRWAMGEAWVLGVGLRIQGAVRRDAYRYQIVLCQVWPVMGQTYGPIWRDEQTRAC